MTSAGNLLSLIRSFSAAEMAKRYTPPEILPPLQTGNPSRLVGADLRLAKAEAAAEAAKGTPTTAEAEPPSLPQTGNAALAKALQAMSARPAESLAFLRPPLFVQNGPMQTGTAAALGESIAAADANSSGANQLAQKGTSNTAAPAPSASGPLGTAQPTSDVRGAASPGPGPIANSGHVGPAPENTARGRVAPSQDHGPSALDPRISRPNAALGTENMSAAVLKAQGVAVSQIAQVPDQSGGAIKGPVLSELNADPKGKTGAIQSGLGALPQDSARTLPVQQQNSGQIATAGTPNKGTDASAPRTGAPNTVAPGTGSPGTGVPGTSASSGMSRVISAPASSAATAPMGTDANPKGADRLPLQEKTAPQPLDALARQPTASAPTGAQAVTTSAAADAAGRAKDGEALSTPMEHSKDKTALARDPGLSAASTPINLNSPNLPNAPTAAQTALLIAAGLQVPGQIAGSTAAPNLEAVLAAALLLGGGTEGARGLSGGVIYNAAMIPGWPYASAFAKDGPAAAKAMQALGQQLADMTPEEMAEYLLKMGARFAILSRLRDGIQVTSTEEKDKLLGFFAALNAALKNVVDGLKAALALSAEELATLEAAHIGGMDPNRAGLSRQRLKL